MKYIIILSFYIFILIGGFYFMNAFFRKSSGTITIGLTGDVMLGRLVNENIKKSSDAYPWGTILPELKRKDFILINLETTLTNSTTIVPKVFNFKADPAVVKTLKIGNIQVVNLANNHSLDFGIEGLEETIATLNQAEIAHVGVGMNMSEAQKPVIIVRNGVRIGIIGLTDNEPTWIATNTKPGTNYISISSPPKAVFEAVKDLKSKVDICIITIHCGPNMQEYPSEEFIRLAHRIVDAGADIFHGHSAHVVQGIQKYKDRIIIYDSGDFVDDYAVDPQLRNDLSFLFSVEVEHYKLKRLILLPVIISNMQVNKAEGADAQLIIDLMKKRSIPFGTLFEQEQNRLIINI